MSVSLILSSGFLFLGGMVMYVIDPRGPAGWFGVLLAVMGAIPLVIHWVQEFWLKKVFPLVVHLVTGYISEESESPKKDN